MREPEGGAWPDGRGVEPIDAQWRAIIYSESTVSLEQLAHWVAEGRFKSIKEAREWEIKYSEITEAQIKSYLLYWDDFILPSIDIGFCSIVDKYEQLEKMGVLKNYWAKMLCGSAARQVYDRLNTQWPGQVVIAAGNLESMDVLDNDGRSLLANLMNTLPVPDKDIPYEDLLNFRLKRRDELLALRASIDDLFMEIVNSPDREFSLVRARSKIIKALDDQCDVMSERKIRFQFAGIQAAIKWEVDLNNAAIWGTLGSAIDLRLGIAAAASNMLPKIELSIGSGTVSSAPSNKPFAYAIRASRDPL